MVILLWSECVSTVTQSAPVYRLLFSILIEPAGNLNWHTVGRNDHVVLISGNKGVLYTHLRKQASPETCRLYLENLQPQFESQ